MKNGGVKLVYITIAVIVVVRDPFFRARPSAREAFNSFIDICIDIPVDISPEVINRLLNIPVDDEQTIPAPSLVSIVPFKTAVPHTFKLLTFTQSETFKSFVTVKEENLLEPVLSLITRVLGTLLVEEFAGLIVTLRSDDGAAKLGLLYDMDKVLGAFVFLFAIGAPVLVGVLDKFAFNVE